MVGNVSETTLNVQAWPAILTWRSLDARIMESARIQIVGKRVRAAGRIINAGRGDHSPYTVSYNVLTDDFGQTLRVSLRITLPTGERQLSLNRDEEGLWTIDDGTHSKRSNYGNNVIDVAVADSPLFASLAMRRHQLIEPTNEGEISVLMVELPSLNVSSAPITYTMVGDSEIQLRRESKIWTANIDGAGFILNFEGIAERI
jgi:hypothetical protein